MTAPESARQAFAPAPLDALDSKLRMVRDHVAEAYHGHATGLVLYGPGGVGKSFLVRDELALLGASVPPPPAHVTPLGLFKTLQSAPDSPHVLDDVEAFYRSCDAASILRAATFGGLPTRPDGKTPRPIHWVRGDAELRTEFTGCLFLVGNRPLPDRPEWRALATRVPSIELSLTGDELAELMRRVAAKGYHRGDHTLSPAECSAVAEVVIAKAAEHRRTLDLRMLRAGYEHYLAAADGVVGTAWQDLIAVGMERAVSTPERPVGRPEGRDEKRARLTETAKRLQALGLPAGERNQRWAEATGLSKDRYYALVRPERAAEAVVG